MTRKLPTPSAPGAARAQSLREAARLPVTLSLAPGEASRATTLGAAVEHARRAMSADAFDPAVHIAEQLRRVPGATLAAHLLLVEAAVRLGRPGDALLNAQRAVDLGLHDPHDALVAAQGLALANRYDAAVALLGAALERAPRDATVRRFRAELLGQLGEKATAVAELRRVLAQDPRQVAAYAALAILDHLTDAEVAALERAPVAPAEQPAAWHALASAARERGDLQREFHCLDEAQRLLALADPWFPHEETEMADAIIARLDRAFFAVAPAAAAGGAQRPVFIVGMPRSGSTLAEQILVTADGVEAAGESGVFPWLLLDLARRRYGEPPYPDIALRLDAADIGRLRADYLDLVARVFTRAPVFVDKQFTNWKYVGLLLQVFPEARFVHTVRDPLDTCLSAYQQCFHSLGYAHSLEHLALELKDQARVMAHWKSLFPQAIHTLAYERLVADPEGEIRALYAFCGLAWTERALRFHETRRSVRTASVAQVRRPLYASAVGRAAAYGALLDPARRVLGG